MELDTSNVVSGLALRLAGFLEGFEERELLHVRVSERNGTERFETRQIREERHARLLRCAQCRRGRYRRWLEAWLGRRERHVLRRLMTSPDSPSSSRNSDASPMLWKSAENEKEFEEAG